MRAIRIVPVLAILTATVLVASIFAFSVVGSVDAIPLDEIEAITLTVDQIDIVHTTDLAVKGEVIVISTQVITFDLLQLQDGVLTGLGISGILPEGFVTQFRFVVIDAQITFDGVSEPLQVPGKVLRFNGVLEVPGGDAVFEITDKSVIFTPSGVKLKSPIKFFESI